MRTPLPCYSHVIWEESHHISSRSKLPFKIRKQKIIFIFWQKNIFPCRSKPLCFGVCQVCKAETGGSFLVDHFLSSFAPSGFEPAADLKQRQELIFHAEHSWAAAVCRHRHCSEATTLVEERCCRTNSQSRQKMSIRGESLNEGSSNPPCITRNYFSGATRTMMSWFHIKIHVTWAK